MGRRSGPVRRHVRRDGSHVMRIVVRLGGDEDVNLFLDNYHDLVDR